MLNGKPILAAVNFTEGAQETLIFAADMAQRMELPLLVLHVVHESLETMGYYRRHNDGNDTLPIEEVGKDLLNRFMDELRDTHPELPVLAGARRIIVPGIPHTRILEIAGLEQAGMIVLGDDGRNAYFGRLIGSISEYVTRHSSIPVTRYRYPTDHHGTLAEDAPGVPAAAADRIGLHVTA